MFYPVTIKDPKGKIKQVIGSQVLEERDNAIFHSVGGMFASHKIRTDVCHREVCKQSFVTKQRGKKYCSRNCTDIVARATAKATKVRRKERLNREKIDN